MNQFNDDELENTNYSVNIIENSFKYLKKFKIYCYLKINNNEYIFPIETDCFNIRKQCVFDLIRNIIKIINSNRIGIIHNSIKYIVYLKDCENKNNKEFYNKNYELRKFSKNTLKPKDDFPCYYINSSLENLINEKICFVSKNSLNIMLYEKYDDYAENEESKLITIVNSKIDNNMENINNKQNINNDSVNKYKESICKSICIIF